MKIMEKKYIKVPFDVEMAKRIQNKECEGRIATKKDYHIRVVCWDRKGPAPIIGLIDIGDGSESIEHYYSNGVSLHKHDEENGWDLMLEIPERIAFKEGDILYARVKNDNWYVFIYRDNGKDKTFFYAAIDEEGTLYIEKNRITENNDISELRFATDEEKQKLIYALKSIINDYAKEYLKKFLSIKQKHEYEFKLKQPVLVRDGEEDNWRLAEFGFKAKENWYGVFGGLYFRHCIPYNEQTAHLIGTTDNCEEIV